MANWHYFTEDREKIGPIEGKVLKQLTLQGVITPETFIEDPTGRTGLAKDVKGLKFPEATLPEPTLSVESNPFITPAPFVPTAQTVPMPPVAAQPPPSVANSTGRILASGTGKGNPALLLYFVAFIITAIMLCAIFVYGASTIEKQIAPVRAARAEIQQRWRVQPPPNPELDRAQSRQAIFIFSALLVPILMLVYGAIYQGSIMGTRIQVADNGIEGKGAGKGFIWGDPRLFGFRLAYNQITSVDVAGSTIIVHASGTQYKCYVKNPTEIQGIIINLQQGRYNEQQLQELAERARQIHDLAHVPPMLSKTTLWIVFGISLVLFCLSSPFGTVSLLAWLIILPIAILSLVLALIRTFRPSR